jgi:hypothetical protein
VDFGFLINKPLFLNKWTLLFHFSKVNRCTIANSLFSYKWISRQKKGELPGKNKTFPHEWSDFFWPFEVNLTIKSEPCMTEVNFPRHSKWTSHSDDLAKKDHKHPVRTTDESNSSGEKTKLRLQTKRASLMEKLSFGAVQGVRNTTSLGWSVSGALRSGRRVVDGWE